MKLSNRFGFVEIDYRGRPAYKSIETGEIFFPEDPIPIYRSYVELTQENKLLKAQLKAQTERSDFIEDCIAEMAGVVYNTEETT